MFDWKWPSILLSTGRSNATKGVLGLSSQTVRCSVELVNITKGCEYSTNQGDIDTLLLPALEDWFSEIELCEDALQTNHQWW